MELSELFHHAKRSLFELSPAASRHLREMVETASIEAALTGLLYCQLARQGYSGFLEYPLSHKKGGIPERADIWLCGTPGLYIEAVQLHLKDGHRFLCNLTDDLKRHHEVPTIGILYLADVKASTWQPNSGALMHKGRNRDSKCGVDGVLIEFEKAFADWFPKDHESALAARLGTKEDPEGYVDIYAFVVSLINAKVSLGNASSR